MRSRSDSEPTRMPTTAAASATCDRRDVPSEAHAFEPHPLDCFVCPPPCLLELGRDRGHREDTAAVRDEPAVAHRRPAVEDEGALTFGLADPVDRCSGVVTPLGVLRPGED